ncbi:MAG: phosphoribosylanthranilate isomerase [Bacteroidales bacterium]|nr:phosphoribosylanthranilate isomerase [Bacteroidales bacterium]
MKVKVCGLRDEKNIRLLLETVLPDYLGFIFYEPSPRYAGEILDISFLQRIKGSFKKTGVLVDASLSTAESIASKYELDALQLHGNESAEFCASLRRPGLEIIKTFHLSESFNFHVLEDYAPVCDYFLFDTRGQHPGGNGVRFNWELLEEYQMSVPFFLSGGIDGQDAASIAQIRHPALGGVDLNSRFEHNPGLKDVSKIKRFTNHLNEYLYGERNL